MDNIFNLIGNFVGKLSTLLLSILSLGIIAEVLFGTPAFGLSVIGNVMAIISLFGSNGVVGIISLVVLYHLLSKN
jgi:ABC-type antimicrobial peptide transport system permease subunit|tara:strand:- start:1659 stop:1883 length:225 start_codon:yes stop_codon:yes gene_type:complete